MEKLSPDQKEMISRAIQVHDAGIQLADEMSRRYGMSIFSGSNILIEQIEIILSKGR